MNENGFQIEAVTFDLWETLLLERDGNSSRRNAARCSGVAEAFNRLGVSVSAEQVGSAIERLIDHLVVCWDGNEDVSHVEQLELLTKGVSKGAFSLKNEWIEELSSAYVSPFFEIPPYLNPEAEDVLESLTKAGKRIGLICNTGLTPGFVLRSFLDSEGVLGHFDFLAFSDEIGLRKPDERVFSLVAKKLRADPEHIIHVGDNLRIDVCGARNAGYKAIHFACEEGKDKTAEADPTSPVARSRHLGALESEQVAPDATVSSFSMLTKAIEQLETSMQNA